MYYHCKHTCMHIFHNSSKLGSEWKISSILYMKNIKEIVIEEEKNIKILNILSLIIKGSLIIIKIQIICHLVNKSCDFLFKIWLKWCELGFGSGNMSYENSLCTIMDNNLCRYFRFWWIWISLSKSISIVYIY